jgi:hypothetical protein
MRLVQSDCVVVRHDGVCIYLKRKTAERRSSRPQAVHTADPDKHARNSPVMQPVLYSYDVCSPA